VLSASVERVAETLRDYGLRADIRFFDTPTRSADEAAQAIGCVVGRIAKSLVFKTAESARPVLAIVSGPNRVDEGLLARRLLTDIGGEKLVRPDAAYVRAVTGFAIGGVAPVAHEVAPVVVVIDEALLQYDMIWAAAGAPNAVFEVAPGELVRITGGRICPIG